MKFSSLLSLSLIGFAITALAWLPVEHGLARQFPKQWAPSKGKMRGVNLGSHFVVEPWMIPIEWNFMGCANYSAENDCVVGLGQKKANANFKKHWDTWVSEKDVKDMASWGLNTIRIPVGWWIKEDLVNSNESFPQGGFYYLERICRWAANHGIYVVMDLHGAPGAQTRWQAFTGMVRSKKPSFSFGLF